MPLRVVTLHEAYAARAADRRGILGRARVGRAPLGLAECGLGVEEERTQQRERRVPRGAADGSLLHGELLLRESCRDPRDVHLRRIAYGTSASDTSWPGSKP